MPNRLSTETSPYLRQHADNPVEWYPWGDEALGRAKAENKPILLSIGYSACHWCHVMEHESFSDADIAALMNAHFINIKVDREVRPDLDRIYQSAMQVTGRAGGWPLTAFLTPSLEPFFLGTYFPPERKYGMPSFRELLEGVRDTFAHQRGEVAASAASLTEAMRAMHAGGASADEGEIPRDMVVRAAEVLARRCDPTHGGFGDRPKFPNTMALGVLLAAHGEAPTAGFGDLARRALDAMAKGGVHDQLGGGFHRYSVDERWLVPHFEKMLYDNALLLRAFVDAWCVFRDPAHEAVVRSTVAYLLREMRSDDGAFYSAQDADSPGDATGPGDEGVFFLWTPAQVRAVLPADAAEIALAVYGVTVGGNFEGGASVLHRAMSVEAAAEARGVSVERVEGLLRDARERLFAVRESRAKPFRDEKRLATWNGLAIDALAAAGMVFGEPGWVRAATAALATVRRVHGEPSVMCRVSMDAGQGGTISHAEGRAFVEDYADLANASLTVFEATQDAAWLDYASALLGEALRRFEDTDHGGFFATESGAAHLLVRAKDAHDNAVPSGTSSMCHALLRLHLVTQDERARVAAERALVSLVASATTNPFAYANAVIAMGGLAQGGVLVVVTGGAQDSRAAALLAEAARTSGGGRMVLRATPGDPRNARVEHLLSGKRLDEPRAYVCRGATCSAPVASPAELRALLNGEGGLPSAP